MQRFNKLRAKHVQALKTIISVGLLITKSVVILGDTNDVLASASDDGMLWTNLVYIKVCVTFTKPCRSLQ